MPRLSRRALLAAGSTAAFVMPTMRARAQRPVSVTVAYAYPQLVQATLQALAEQFMQHRPDIRIALQGAQPGYDELLQGALRDLMQTKNIDEISVQDITDAATVNRATFYDHYTDKFSLLEAMVASGFHMLLHERNV